ncbi:phosphate signaling complex protein PhoU [Parvibium lacunae]|uniref:Phosphate-specific transport system accessory protein PhoU n=1 Tax=Parvibium lacunae TaxID=1888893 RepID=A0A368L7E6_9BURK|nr:phosphate signaling complex protein PhoU [Parvibium lacunae]RCS59482.1 phosphate transport system regulatory protein PhoU [Parvibium lacunae]
MNEHTFKQYDQELERLRSTLLQMGGAVEQQIINAIEAFVDGDLLLVNQVIRRESEINKFETDLDDACTNFIARLQPAAYDLRMVLTVGKMTRDLERVGDEAEKIARNAKLIHDAGRTNMPRVEISSMGNQAVDMLRQSLNAFARLDAPEAAAVIRQDLSLDDQFSSVFRQLVTYMMEDPRTISRSIDLLFIAKALERIGDHAKNMAEQVVYLVKGQDIRHQGVEQAETTARI